MTVRSPLILMVLVLLMTGTILSGRSWDKKPCTKWSQKDVRRILEDSPWTSDYTWMTRADSEETFYGFGSEREIATIFRLTLFSARVVREAYVCQAARGDYHKFQKYHDFMNRPYDEIVLALTLDSSPKGVASLIHLRNQLISLSTPDLAANTFLVNDSGDRLYLKNYIPPTRDGTGAKFIFSRLQPDGTPFIDGSHSRITFHTISFEIRENVAERRMSIQSAKYDAASQRTNMARFSYAQSPHSSRSVWVSPSFEFSIPDLVYRGKTDY